MTENSKHYNFDFNVLFLEENNEENNFDDMEDMKIKFPDYTIEDIVCHWYNTLDEINLISFGEKNVIFKYDKKKKVYNVSFDIDDPDVDDIEFIFNRLIDPDEDGNYPIKIGGSIYLITGEPKD